MSHLQEALSVNLLAHSFCADVNAEGDLERRSDPSTNIAFHIFHGSETSGLKDQ